MAKPRPGMGRGLDAILSVSTEGVQHSADELRELPVELISPNPKQPRRALRAGVARGAGGVAGRARGAAAGARAPATGRRLRVGRRRATLASGAHRRLGEHPGDRARTRGCAGAGSGARREYGARGSQPDRGGTRVRCARRGAGTHPRGRGTARGAQSRGGQQPGAAARPARRGNRARAAMESSARATGGHCCSRTDHGERRRLARAAAAEGWSVRVTEERARESNSGSSPNPAARPDGAPRAVHPDQEQAAREIAQTLAVAFGSEVRVKPTSDGRYSAQLSFASAEDARELAQRIRPLESAAAGD